MVIASPVVPLHVAVGTVPFSTTWLPFYDGELVVVLQHILRSIRHFYFLLNDVFSNPGAKTYIYTFVDA